MSEVQQLCARCDQLAGRKRAGWNAARLNLEGYDAAALSLFAESNYQPPWQRYLAARIAEERQCQS